MKKTLIILSAIALMVAGCCNSPKEECCGDCQDAALANIFARKSVRSFTDQAVPDEMVETLLKAAMAAPTAMNSQPWSFIVVNDKEMLEKCHVAYNPPMAIIVCGQTMAQNGMDMIFWQQDCSAATENLLLAAEALGLGAVWTAGYPALERVAPIREALGIPDDIMPLCVIPIGFPAGETPAKDKWVPEKVHYNQW